MMQPYESLQTAACTEKVSLIAVSKVMEKVPAGGGHHFSKEGTEDDFQALKWSRVVFLIVKANSIGLGIEPSWTALFLLNQRRSHKTAAYIWNRWESFGGIPKKFEGDKSPLIQSATSIEAQASESKGQKEFLQAILAKLHLKKRWEVESVSVLQRGQSKSLGGMLRILFSLDFDGSK